MKLQELNENPVGEYVVRVKVKDRTYQKSFSQGEQKCLKKLGIDPYDYFMDYLKQKGVL